MTCPHCHQHNLLRDADQHGDHYYCLNCGYYYDLTLYIGEISQPEMRLPPMGIRD